jgi:hypothetical protein
VGGDDHAGDRPRAFLDMFAEFEMKDIGVEESREMYGLLLVGGWMAVLGHRAFWRGRSRDS